MGGIDGVEAGRSDRHSSTGQRNDKFYEGVCGVGRVVDEMKIIRSAGDRQKEIERSGEM